MILPLLAAAAAAVTLPPPDQLRAQIAARDAELFDVLFLQCDPKHMRSLLADDIEFYHDKGGLDVGADAFMADYVKTCTERQKPDAWRSRRELNAASATFDPVPGAGAIHTGEHFFWERKGNGPEKRVGRSLFANYWRWTADGWKLARVFSYAHGPAPKP